MLNGIPSLHQLNERLDRKPDASHIAPPTSIGWYILSGVMVTTAVTAIALKAMNIQGMGQNPWIGTLLPLVAGGCLQQAYQGIVPRNWSNIEKTFLADYAVPIFLITTQVYANIPYISLLAKEIIYAALTAQAGMCLSAFIHSAFTRRLSEQDDNLPLMAGMESSEEVPKKIPVAFLGSSKQRLIWGGIVAVVGVSAIVAGSILANEFARDFGILVSGIAAGALPSELWLRRIVPIQTEYNTKPLDSQEPPPAELTRYYTITKIFLAVARVLPGALIVLAKALDHTEYANYSLALSIPCYALPGILAGGTRNTERARFTEVPIKELTELRKKEAPLTTAEKTFAVFKWFIAVPVVGGFLGLGIAGFDFASLSFKHVTPLAQASLAAFSGFLYGSYALAELAKRKFNPEENSLLKNYFFNHLYFYTHYSLSVPLYGLYVLSRMQIGDKALSGYDATTGFLVATAYADLGYAVGTEANARGEFQMPTVLSSLAAGLFGKFIVSQFLKRA